MPDLIMSLPDWLIYSLALAIPAMFIGAIADLARVVRNHRHDTAGEGAEGLGGFHIPQVTQNGARNHG